MFKRLDVTLTSNPVCLEPIYNINADDFKFYDKDGFELNVAEQAYYRMMRYPVDIPILNHHCWQEPWFKLDNVESNLRLDHCMILHRCNYGGYALHQLEKIKKEIPEASLLINTKQKWGFDFALDAIDSNGNMYEVLHVEYDSYDYDNFSNKMIWFNYEIRHKDWVDAAKKILSSKDQWQHLKGFDQNHWKANYLLGWNLAEYTEKSI